MGKRQSGFQRSSKPTGYEKTPDKLMGTGRRSGTGQPFHESKIKQSHRVMVEVPGQKAFKDEIRGRNPAEALERAKRNWPNAVGIRVTRLIKDAAGKVLSPAGLAEDVVGRVARNAISKKDLRDYGKKQVTKRPRDKT